MKQLTLGVHDVTVLKTFVTGSFSTLGSRHWTKYQSNSVITISTIETHRESIQKAIFIVLLSCTFSKQTDF